MRIFQIFAPWWVLFFAFSSYAAKLEFKNPLDNPKSEVPVFTSDSYSAVDELKKYRDTQVSLNLKLKRRSSYDHSITQIVKVLKENNLTVHSLSLEGLSGENAEGMIDLIENCSGLQRLYFSVENDLSLTALKIFLSTNTQVHTVYLDFDSFRSSDRETSPFFIALKALAMAPSVKTIYLKGSSYLWKSQTIHDENIENYSGLKKVESLCLDPNQLSTEEKVFFTKIGTLYIRHLRSFGLNVSSAPWGDPDTERWLDIFRQPLLTDLSLDLPTLPYGNHFFENLITNFPFLQNLHLNRPLNDSEMKTLAKMTGLKSLSLSLSHASQLKQDSFVALFEGLRHIQSLNIEIGEAAYKNEIVPELSQISSRQLTQVRMVQPFAWSKVPIQSVSELLKRRLFKKLELGPFEGTPEEWQEFYRNHPQIGLPQKHLALEWLLIVPKNQMEEASPFLRKNFDEVKLHTSTAESRNGLEILTVGLYLNRLEEIVEWQSRIEIVKKAFPNFRVISEQEAIENQSISKLKPNQIGIFGPKVIVENQKSLVFESI